ncbi:hypothetical protein V8C35DRAFT_326351 [Trichoderma chlorosporum]
MIVPRRLLGVSLVLFGLFVSHGLSSTIAVDQECLSAVFGIVGGLNFEGLGYGNYFLANCQNPLNVASVYAIAKTYCPPSDLEPGVDYLNSSCQTNGGVVFMPEADVAANLTDEAISRFPILNQTDVSPMENLTTPVLISRDWFNLGFRTEDTWDYENRTHTTYGFAMYGFWGGILIIGTLHRLITLFLESRLPPSSTDPEDTGTADSREKSATRAQPFANLYSKIRKHFVIPSALPPYHRQLFFGCTIPTRMESFVVFSYWVINFVLCCVNYRGFTGNLYWSAVTPQIWRYIADRAGIIAFANLPLLWMFSGRNNIFIWLTGWHFSIFNLFHRHIARIATLQAIIHSIGYTAFYFTADYADDYREQFHDACHTSIFDGQYEPYLWPLVAIWSFERSLRILRVVYCNLHVRLRKKAFHRSIATIAYDQNENIVQVQINTHVKPKPGQHYFLYQPFRLTGWENHPFTLAHWSTSSRNTDDSVLASFETGLPRAVMEDEYLFSFWIRPHDGWTRHLRDLCLKSQSLPQLSAISKQTILLEGPYGMAKPLWAFDEVFLIAGGSGIATMVPYILDHIKRAVASNKSNQTRIRRLTLVWSDRKQAFIHRIAQRELAAALTRDDIRCMFYCTESAKNSVDLCPLPSTNEITVGDAYKEIAESSVLKGKEETDISESIGRDDETGSLTIRMCRPDIPIIIDKAAASATKSGSRLAVMACGPGGMADAAREATYRAMRQPNHSIEYFEEAFGW